LSATLQLGTDYAELKRRVREAGLLGRQRWFYALLLSGNAVLLTACYLALWRFHQPWALVLSAAALGLVSAQLGFQLHDAGHHQIFERAWKNHLTAFVTADLLIGMSARWWIDSHTRHHAHPNHVDVDPDLSNIALSYTPEQALGRHGLFRVVARYQAFLFLPMISMVAWSMHTAGALWLGRRGLRRSWPELAALAAHAVAYVALVVHLVGPWGALLVIVVHKAVSGVYLASVVAPNHHGMAQTAGDTRVDFLRRQVMTSRNVRAHWLTDVWFGSLNYQIEHHLFPRMTRLHVRRARPIVRQFCAERGIPYHETSFVGSYVELLRFLHEVGEPVRRPQPAPA